MDGLYCEENNYKVCDAMFKIYFHFPIKCSLYYLNENETLPWYTPTASLLNFSMIQKSFPIAAFSLVAGIKSNLSAVT